MLLQSTLYIIPYSPRDILSVLKLAHYLILVLSWYKHALQRSQVLTHSTWLVKSFWKYLITLSIRSQKQTYLKAISNIYILFLNSEWVYVIIHISFRVSFYVACLSEKPQTTNAFQVTTLAVFLTIKSKVWWAWLICYFMPALLCVASAALSAFASRLL